MNQESLAIEKYWPKLNFRTYGKTYLCIFGRMERHLYSVLDIWKDTIWTYGKIHFLIVKNMFFKYIFRQFSYKSVMTILSIHSILPPLILFLALWLTISMGHTDTKTVDILGHKDTETVYILGHMDTETVERLGHTDTKTVDILGHTDIKSVDILGHTDTETVDIFFGQKPAFCIIIHKETHGQKNVYKRRHTDKKMSTKGDTRT